MKIASVSRILWRLGIGAACLFLLGCPDAPERARLEAIHSFEAMIPGLVRELRDSLFLAAKGEPVGEKAALPTKFLKNLDYRIDPTAVRKYPFLGTLQVEFGSGGAGNGATGVDSLEQRYLVSLDFVESRGAWKLYYSRVLSPSRPPENTESRDLNRILDETLGPWRFSAGHLGEKNLPRSSD